MQRYALNYPEHIAAFVLVDSAHEDQIDEMPQTNYLQLSNSQKTCTLHKRGKPLFSITYY